MRILILAFQLSTLPERAKIGSMELAGYSINAHFFGAGTLEPTLVHTWRVAIRSSCAPSPFPARHADAHRIGSLSIYCGVYTLSCDPAAQSHLTQQLGLDAHGYSQVDFSKLCAGGQLIIGCAPVTRPYHKDKCLIVRETPASLRRGGREDRYGLIQCQG
ncbi:hypothetical protein BOTBODRAFT_32463 [Botryobasidium botryosum FD-172 SS1]|uniref:Uncharacterized protein n=1 Tax=Botryobasidium botryosum (strain FD-172 SS1) TaxID=930990 RepID=A0A067MGP4_BOTB1|nr:hypothetical protein BOTBODRAFT_32463 [Botryobasidium botryosum FD-172 SS1]